MKRYTILVVIAFLFIACNSSDTKTSGTSDINKSDSKDVAIADIQTVNFIVGGMTCEGCENSVKKYVSKEEGIVEVSASHVEKNAIVKFDANKTSIEKIEKIIADVGYEVLGQKQEEDILPDSSSID